MGLDTLALVLAGIAAFSLALTLLADAAVFAALGEERRSGPTPPLSILKPVKGDEDGLYDNLVSFARQDYPIFELLVGAEDASDPALAVARRVQLEHPGVRIRIHAGCRPIGLNPKVNLLAMLARRARYDVVLISDSNVHARPGYLRETARELADPRVGLVTNLPASAAACGAGSLLETLHLNSWVAAAVSAARVWAGRACVVGKSMMFRLSDLQSLGGFDAVRNVLAEDYVIGRAFEQAGFRVALSSHVIEATTRGWTLDRFLNRHVRWAQMRRRLCIPAYAAEILLNPTAWIALAMFVSSRAGFDARAFACGAVAVALKAAGDAAVSRRLGAALQPAHLLLVPLKDLLVAGVWVVGAFRRTVDWRGNRLRIGAGTELFLPGEEELLAPQEAA